MLVLILFLSVAFSATVTTTPLSKFQVSFRLRYPQQTNAYVDGTFTYDLSGRIFNFNYPNQQYTETYQFNTNFGYTNYDTQFSFKQSTRNAACSPCASYNNQNSFPLFFNTATPRAPAVPSGFTATLPTRGATTNGCTLYTYPSGHKSYVTKFSLDASSNLCYFETQDGRQFTVTGVSVSYDDSLFYVPTDCKCIKPLDLSLSLDRSGSITVDFTTAFKNFLVSFVDRFEYDPTLPYSTQLGISQWATTSYPRAPSTSALPGTIEMTQNENNIKTAVSRVGCTAASPCNFCGGRTGGNSCLDGFTCTACGIRTAADVMAARPLVRADAAKALIVFTDGNSNTAFQDGNSNGRCCGGGDSSAVSPNGGTCIGPDDDGAGSKIRGCWYDIRQAVAYAKSRTPGLVVYAIGIGTQVSQATLTVIADGISANTLLVSGGFAQLSSKIDDILRLACPEPDPVDGCGPNCCGFCVCGTCQLPDGIDTPNINKCDKIAVQGLCYTASQDPLACPDQDRCNSGSCDRTLNGGLGGCKQTPINCQIVNQCYDYECDPTNGCAATTYQCNGGTCPGGNPCTNGCCGQGQCTLSTDCNLPGTCSCNAGVTNVDANCCPLPTPVPTPVPTNVPTPVPTASPTPVPTEPPSLAPATPVPTPAPTTPVPTPVPTAPPTEAPTPAPTIPCQNLNFCGGFGTCTGGACVCNPGFSGDKCQFQNNIPECTLDTQCNDSNNCTTDICDKTAPNGGTCKYTINPPCNDNSVCTIDTCDKVLGCVFTPIPCDDNNLCTDDTCDPVNGCKYTNVSCASLVTICNDAYCDPQKNKTNQCTVIEKICPPPKDNNCTNTQCFLPVLNAAKGKDTCRKNPNSRTPDVGGDNDKLPYCHAGGCEVEYLDCGNAALAAGLAAGAVAGIAIGAAAVAGAGIAGGGAVAAASQTKNNDDMPVFSNPVFQAATTTSAGLST